LFVDHADHCCTYLFYCKKYKEEAGLDMSQIIALIIKEFRAVWRDKATRSLLFIPPILQLLIFSFAVTLEVKNITIAVYNQDSGRDSYELIQRFAGSPQFSDIVYLSNDPEIVDTMDKRKAIMTLKFPPDFSRKVRRGEKATLQAILDGRRANSSLIVLGYVNEIASTFGTEVQPIRGVPDISTIVTSRHWFNENLEYTWFTGSCLVGILGLIPALSLSSLTIAREREMGTFEQILVTPLTPPQILIGKLLPAVILAMINALVIFLFAIFAFKVPFEGSFLYLSFSMFVFLLSVIGVGLFISSLSTTQQQSVLGTFLFLSPTMTLSGFGTPVENIPYWMQYVAEIFPLKHFLIVAKGLFLKDMPFSAVWANTWPNLIIAAFTMSVSIWLFRRRME
jgi:ABC-2 type transport system permease protein